ncbi:MAG TPA: DISARM system SNF2-like helicase DrmD [Bacteriovoracaceae bacterium]|nr:DISARM system SNF2-like helicase DrmD [Bacteriovoracaceae bacterium]
MADNTFHDQSIPEAGQLVEARRRQWIVSDIEKSTLANTKPQHLVKLTSVDEDALGEELNVIWEIELGARKLENAGLPKFSGYDDPEKIDAFLDAVRWGAVTNADRGFLQSPFRSGITIEDYQLDPLVRAIDMARVNLLIADDVGLGKTIEAGLIIQELIVRHRVRSVLVVCPADLQIKWQTEMQEKFGLEFKIVDTDYVKTLRRERGIHTNPWTSFPRLIASMDWMKAGDPLRMLKDVLPPHTTYPRKFDMLVIDEAHNVAPSMASSNGIESLRTQLVRTIAPHFEHRLFLTATPHNGYLESFTSLLELLDDQRFARTVEPDEKQLQKILVRRLKTDLTDAQGNPLYHKRELCSLNVDYTEDEIKTHALLNKFTKSRVESAKKNGYEFGLEFMHKLLKKRLFSSPSSFSVSINKHKQSIVGGKPRDNSGKKDRDDRDLRKAIMEAQDSYAKDSEQENYIDDAIEEVSKLPLPLTKEEGIMLDQLQKWAETNANRPDSKAKAILKWLDENIKINGEWSDNKVILFTEYRPTQSWLNQIFSSHGFGAERLVILNGDTPFDEREKIKAAFQAKPSESPLRILIATDAASEGIDLQNHCNFLFHVEIPWNPNVMEQRNGRIDRHGQKKTPYIWHPVGSNSNASGQELLSDDEFLMKVVKKVDAIREDLGSVGPVIASQIEEVMLGRRKALDTQQAEDKALKAKKYLTLEKELKKKIERLHDRVLETKKDFHLTPERIESAVKTALSIADLPNIKNRTPNIFDVPVLPGAWGRSLKGLEHPHTGTRRPITFDQEIAKGQDDIVLAHLNHRLVQMCLRLLRAEVWALEDTKKLHRVAFRISKEVTSPTILVFSRLVITGGRHHRLHEELTLSGLEIKSGRLVRIDNVGDRERIYDSSAPLMNPNKEDFNSIKQLVESQEKSILTAIEARSKERLKSLTGTLDRRKHEEINNLNEILNELEKTLTTKIKEDELKEIQQLLPNIEWNDPRRQLRKDHVALKTRLERIPSERKHESNSIIERYSALLDRTFPVCMVIILPDGGNS